MEQHDREGAKKAKLLCLECVPPNASAETIRFAFKQLALQCHPDKAGQANSVGCVDLVGTIPSAVEHVVLPDFTDVQEAYEVLGDVSRRYLYDLSYENLLYQQRLLQERILHRREKEKSLETEREKSMQVWQENSSTYAMRRAFQEISTQESSDGDDIEDFNDEVAMPDLPGNSEKRPTKVVRVDTQAPEACTLPPMTLPKNKAMCETKFSGKPCKSKKINLQKRCPTLRSENCPSQPTKKHRISENCSYTYSASSFSKALSSANETVLRHEQLPPLCVVSLGVPSLAHSTSTRKDQIPLQKYDRKELGKFNSYNEDFYRARAVKRAIEYFFIARREYSAKA